MSEHEPTAGDDTDERDGLEVPGKEGGATTVSEHDVHADETTPPADIRTATHVDPDVTATEDEEPVPVDQGRSRATGAVIALGATALSIWLLREFSSIIAPVFLGVNLLITAYPVYTWLAGRKVPRFLASLATGVAVLLVLLLGVAAIIWSGTSMVNALLGYSDQFTKLYNNAIALVSRLGFNEAQLVEQLKSISPSNVLGVVRGVLSNASSAGGIILVVLVAMVFMLMDLPSVAKRLGIADRVYPRFTNNVESFVSGIRRYWLVTTVFGLIVAVLDGFALLALGVSLPVVWAVLSFITNYIPNIGFVIGLVPPALLALVEQGPVTALLVVVIYSVLNFVLQSIVQPKFTGDAVGITPTVSFLSLLLWAAVFGPLGALIALPFTLMIKAMLIDDDPRGRWINVLIASNPEQSVKEAT